MLAPGAQLAQITGDLTTATTALTAANLNVEVHFITVQVDASVTCTIYHDNDGTTYTLATQIWQEARTTALNKEAAYNESRPVITIAPGGSIGVKCSGANNATFTFYGVVAEGR